MQLEKLVADFIRSPLDPNQDGKTSLGELFAAVGLLSIMAIAWKRILNLLWEE